MIEDKDANAFAAEFTRQLRSAQMSRFVSSHFGNTVQPHLPDRFLELLRKLDQAQKRPSAAASQPRRPRI